MPLHKCFCISIFTLLHLQRPRLQHTGLGDKKPPSSLLVHLVSTSRTAKPVLTSASFCVPWTFLKLFFTRCLIGMLCTYTNDSANTVGPQNPSLCQSWSNTYPEEFYHFIGLLMYMSTVHSI